MRPQGARTIHKGRDTSKRPQVTPVPPRADVSPHLQVATLHQASPAAILSLQRTIGNRAVSQMIQRTFDEGSITSAINDEATSIHFLGGTEGAYQINTSSEEHPRLVIKAVSREMPIFAAWLAQQVGVNTPEIISVPTEPILEKVTQLHPKLGLALGKSERATVQKFVTGKALDEKPKITSKTLGQIGNIASFDMMIGKEDLFNNYTESYYKEDNEQNFKNILFQGSDAFDIDLDNGVKGSLLDHSISYKLGTQKAIIDGIIAEPTTIAPFITRNIGGLMDVGETGVPVRGINGLKIQRGMLQTIVRAGKTLEPQLGEMPKGGKFDAIKEMIAYYAEIAPAAKEAIGLIDVRIEELEEEAQERERERELEQQRRREERLVTVSTSKHKKTKKKKSSGCIIL